MNSNLDLATRILNDYITTGDPAALAAVCDLIEEANSEAADRVRELADAIPADVDLYWCCEALDFVHAVLEALGANRAAREAAVREIYDTAIEVS